MVARQRPRRLRRGHRRRLADAALPRSAGGARGSSAGTPPGVRQGGCHAGRRHTFDPPVHQPLGRRGTGAVRPCAYRVVPPGRAHAGVALRRRRPAPGAAHLDGAGCPYHLCRLPPAARHGAGGAPAAAAPHAAGERPRSPRQQPALGLQPGDRGRGGRTARASSRALHPLPQGAGRRHRIAPRLVRQLRPAAGTGTRPAGPGQPSVRRRGGSGPVAGRVGGSGRQPGSRRLPLPPRSPAAGAGSRCGQPQARPGAGEGIRRRPGLGRSTAARRRQLRLRPLRSTAGPRASPEAMAECP